MAIGVSIQTPEGYELVTVSQCIGQGTNNMAEYYAAIEGLERARGMGIREIELRLDSELVVKQVSGEYTVRKEELQDLHKEVQDLLKGFQQAKVIHIRRGVNARADALANLAFKSVSESEG
jgi:ribonuclease HI